MSPLPHLPSFRLDGRWALVTGAGRGIGLAAAAALAQAGAAVTLVARSGTEIEAAAAAIRAENGQAEALRLDVGDPVAVVKALALRDPTDILVNNAGTNRPAAFTELTVKDFDAVASLNLRAAFFVAQAVAKGLIAAGRAGSCPGCRSRDVSRAGIAGRRGRRRPRPGAPPSLNIWATSAKPNGSTAARQPERGSGTSGPLLDGPSPASPLAGRSAAGQMKRGQKRQVAQPTAGRHGPRGLGGVRTLRGRSPT